MQLARTVVTFVNDLDVKQREVIAALTIEADRLDKQVVEVNQHLTHMTILEEGIKNTRAKLLDLNAGTTAFAASTQAELEATALANKEAHQKAGHVH